MQHLADSEDGTVHNSRLRHINLQLVKTSGQQVQPVQRALRVLISEALPLYKLWHAVTWTEQIAY